MASKKENSQHKRDKLLIIDGNALIHRSFHALPPTMTTKTGMMVNAVYGFTTVLLKAIREFNPTYIALTLDKKGPTFRHEQFKEYKAKRVAAPDDLYAQIPLVKDLARSFNIPIYESLGFEADDLIGTIAEKVEPEVEKIIVTGDMDTLQLVNDHTRVYTMSRGLSDSVLYDDEGVINKYGLKPDQMIDYKALRGDPSDNIPGVRGIGEKGAVELLQNFKTLDGVYGYLENTKTHLPAGKAGKNKNKIKERIEGLLKQYKEDAYMSRDLATIKTDVKINFKLEEARFGDFDTSKVTKFLSDLEFKSLLPRIHTMVNKSQGDTKEEKVKKIEDKFARNKKLFKYNLVDPSTSSGQVKFNLFLKKLKQQKEFTFDTETSSFNPITSELLGISFSWEKGVAYYLATRNSQLATQKSDDNLFNYKSQRSIVKDQLSKAHPWLKKLKPIFENEKIRKNAHNMKFDIRVMRSNGVDTKGIYFDTMIASYLLNPGTRQHNLDALTFTELGHEKITKADLLGTGRDKIKFSEVETEKLSLYSCEDADFTNQLVKKLKKQLSIKKLDKLFKEIEMPLVEVLSKMEDDGVQVDRKFLANIRKKIDKKINILEEKIYKQAKTKFNINSTQQLRIVLFEKLEIPTLNVSKTKTGLSTAADELHKLKDLHPIIKLIQEYRELNKLSTTYINALPELINKKTGRVHTSFNQAVTATGRLSSTEPNLQNIPIKTELGREIRKAFVAQKGYKLLAFDYSQIELRLAAHMSGDKKMIKAFKEGIDIHTSTAAEINQVEREKVTKEMRREAKATNFGILYGQGPHGLSQTADIPYFRAKEFIDQYFVVYKGVKKFIDETIKFACEKGYAETLLDRRRYLPEINSSVVMVRKGAERMATNTPLQGTAADMIKIAMIEVEKVLNKKFKKDEVKMIIQVHDELLFEVKSAKAKEAESIIKKIMENVIDLKVPVIVDASVGDNWGEMET